MIAETDQDGNFLAKFGVLQLEAIFSHEAMGLPMLPSYIYPLMH